MTKPTMFGDEDRRDWQFATIYDAATERPLASVQRRGVLGCSDWPDGYKFSVTRLDGRQRFVLGLHSAKLFAALPAEHFKN